MEHYTDLYSTDKLISKSALEEMPQITPLSDPDAEPTFKDIDKAIAELPTTPPKV